MDAGSVNSSAIHATEDAAARRTARPGGPVLHFIRSSRKTRHHRRPAPARHRCGGWLRLVIERSLSCFAPRHPQDLPRGRDHGGEPLVRLLLRHLSRRRRDPDEGRRADGLRARTASASCVRPFHEPNGADDSGGAHGPLAGKRTSTAAAWTASSASPTTRSSATAGANGTARPARTLRRPTSWATTTTREIPNYWAYAQNFVLQDHMFEPNSGWSLPAHLWLVSGWSARAATRTASTCTSNLDRGTGGRPRRCAAIPTGRSTAGPTSPTSSTSTASAGRTTW